MTIPLTIAVAAYNVAPWLPRCLNSLPGNENLEILLIDDGSTDETGAICEEFARRDSRVRVIHRENGGLSVVRNQSIAEARGEYLWFIDGDDTLAPGAAESILPLLEDYRPELLRFGYRRIDEKGNSAPWRLPYGDGLYTGDGLTPLQLDTISYPKVLDYGTPRVLSACCCLCRREFLLTHKLRFVSEREILSEDYLFVLQAMCAASRVYVCGITSYEYHYRAGSLSNTPQPNMMVQKRKLWAAYWESVPREEREAQARMKNFYIDCVYHCFTVACRTSRSPAEATAAIRPLLEDPVLQQCLRDNWDRIGSLKVWCICVLMRCRAANAMYRLYRLCK